MPGGQQPNRSGNAKMFVILGLALVVIVGGIVTALILTLGDDDGEGDNNSASDEDQIEQVVKDYDDAYQKLLDGDASACDDLIDLVSEDSLEGEDIDSCRDEAPGMSAGNISYEVKFKSAEVDGDTATATVDIVSDFGDGVGPSTREDEMPLVKEGGEWKLSFDESSSDEPSIEAPSLNTPDYDDPSDTYSYGDDPSSSPTY